MSVCFTEPRIRHHTQESTTLEDKLSQDKITTNLAFRNINWFICNPRIGQISFYKTFQLAQKNWFYTQKKKAEETKNRKSESVE